MRKSGFKVMSKNNITCSLACRHALLMGDGFRPSYPNAQGSLHHMGTSSHQACSNFRKVENGCCGEPHMTPFLLYRGRNLGDPTREVPCPRSPSQCSVTPPWNLHFPSTEFNVLFPLWRVLRQCLNLNTTCCQFSRSLRFSKGTHYIKPRMWT